MNIGNISHSDSEKISEITSLINAGGEEIGKEENEEVEGQAVREDGEQTEVSAQGGEKPAIEGNGQQSGEVEQGHLVEINSNLQRLEGEAGKVNENYNYLSNQLQEAEALYNSGQISGDQLVNTRRQIELGMGQLRQHYQQVTNQYNSNQQYAKQEIQKSLVTAIPSWKDPEVFKSDKEAIRRHLKDSGFNENEIKSINSVKTIKYLHDAIIGGGSSNAQRSGIKLSDINRKSYVEKAAADVKKEGGHADQQVASLFRKLGLGIR